MRCVSTAVQRAGNFCFSTIFIFPDVTHSASAEVHLLFCSIFFSVFTLHCSERTADVADYFLLQLLIHYFHLATSLPHLYFSFMLILFSCYYFFPSSFAFKMISNFLEPENVTNSNSFAYTIYSSVIFVEEIENCKTI